MFLLLAVVIVPFRLNRGKEADDDVLPLERSLAKSNRVIFICDADSEFGRETIRASPEPCLQSAMPGRGACRVTCVAIDTTRI